MADEEKKINEEDDGEWKYGKPGEEILVKESRLNGSADEYELKEAVIAKMLCGVDGVGYMKLRMVGAFRSTWVTIPERTSLSMKDDVFRYEFLAILEKPSDKSLETETE